MLSAIVFDMDDTLFEEKQFALSGYKAIDRCIQERYKAAGFSELAAALFESGERQFIINRTLKMMNINDNEDLVEEMISLYRSHAPDICLLKDAEWVLDHLRHFVKIGLISDGYCVTQENKVKALGLERRFDCIILTDRLGRDRWKPSPVPYEQMCRELGLSHQHCVYIGDNVAKDFVTANLLGWTTVHIHRAAGVYSGIEARPEYNAHYKINDLRELIHIPRLQHLFKTTPDKAVI